jgi:hypothetical protein
MTHDTQEKTSKNNNKLQEDITQLGQLARQVMDRMQVMLEAGPEDNAELFGGRYSLVSALNTLTGLILSLEARQRLIAGGDSNDSTTNGLPLSEADVQLLEQFLGRQHNQPLSE